MPILALSIVYLLFYLASQHVLQFFQHVYLLFAMFYYFDDVGLAFLGQGMPKYYVCAQIYMPRCFLLRLCLDSHVHLLLAMLCLDLYVQLLLAIFMPRSICLCALCHIYAQIYTLMCFMPYLCRDDNFFPPRLTHPSLFRSAKVMGWGWGKILALHHRARRG